MREASSKFVGGSDMAMQKGSDVSISDSELITNVERSTIQQKHRSFQTMYRYSLYTNRRKRKQQRELKQAPTAKRANYNT
jgi:hypothetical protein